MVTVNSVDEDEFAPELDGLVFLAASGEPENTMFEECLTLMKMFPSSCHDGVGC